MPEQIPLPNGKTLTIPDGISPEDRDLLATQVKQKYGVDINSTTLESILSAPVDLAKGIARGVSQGFLDYPLTLGAVDVGNDNRLVKDIFEKKRYLAEDSLVAADPEGRTAGTLGQAIGSTIPFILGGWKTRALRRAGTISKGQQAAITLGLVAAPTGTARQVEKIDRAKALGEEVSPLQEITAELFGGLIGTTEALPIANIFRRASKTALKDFGMREKLKSIGIAAGVEGTQELSASILQDLTARGIYSDKLPIGESMMEEFTMGATVGGLFDAILNTAAGRRGVANQHHLEQEEQLRKNKTTLHEAKKFDSAVKQGEVEELQPLVDVNVPTIPVPPAEVIEPLVLETIQNPDGTFSVIDTLNIESPVVQTFNTEADALVFKNEEINNRRVNNLKARIENALYNQGLINSSTAFEIGQVMLDPNSTQVTATTLFNYDSRIPENITPEERAKKWKASNLNKDKTYTMTEARKYLPSKDFQLLLHNLAEVSFKQSEKEGKPSLYDDKSEINTTPKYITNIARTKNIKDFMFGNKAVSDFSLAVTGYSNVTKAPKAAKELFLARLYSLPSFNNETMFPDFSFREYSAIDMAEFVANAKANKQEFTKNDVYVALKDVDAFTDLLSSNRIERIGKSHKYKIRDNFEFDMARKAEGFNETPEEFGNRLRGEGVLSEEQIERLVEQETVRQQDFLPPEDVLPRAINFAQTVELGRKNKFAQEIRKMLDGVGLTDTGVVVSEDILATDSLIQEPDGTIIRDPKAVEGVKSQYDKETDTIFVSLNAINPDGSATDAEIQERIMDEIDGDIVRALREKDLFTEKEYQFLRKYVKRTKVPNDYDPQYTGQSFYQRSKSLGSEKAQRMLVLEGANPDTIEEMYVEEAIADLYKSRRYKPNLAPKAEGIFGKIVNFYKSIGQAMRRASINNAQEIFTSIEEGGVGLRERGEIRTLKELDRRSLLDELQPAETAVEIDEDIDTESNVTVMEDGTRIISTPTGYYSGFDFGGIKGIDLPTPTRETAEEDVTEPTEEKLYDAATRTRAERRAEETTLVNELQGKDTIQVMDWLSKNGPDAFYRDMAKRLKARFVEMRKVFRNSGLDDDYNIAFHLHNPDKPKYEEMHSSVAKYAKKNPSGLAGFFLQNNEGRNPAIVVYHTGGTSALNYDTVLHEAIHTATSQLLTLGGIARGRQDMLAAEGFGMPSPTNEILEQQQQRAVEFYNDINRLRLAAKRRYNQIINKGEFITNGPRGTGYYYTDAQGRDVFIDTRHRYLIEYGLTNVDEMMAVSLSNRGMQLFLEQITYRPKDKKNLWTKFVESIRKSLQLPAKHDSYLSHLLRISDAALNIPISKATKEDVSVARAPPNYKGSLNSAFNLYDYIKNNPEGFTVDILNPDAVLSGHSVAPLKSAELVVDANELTESDVEQFISNIQNLAEVSGQKVFAGGWLNNEDGKYYLDAVHLIDSLEDALYIAEAGQQEAVFDLTTFNETNTEQGIQTLRETGRYNSESARLQRENTKRLDEAFQKARNKNPKGLTSIENTFGLAKRYAQNDNTNRNRKLLKATEKAEEIARSSPIGYIPEYNVNASDVAIEAALEFRTPEPLGKPADPSDIPHEEGKIPDEINDVARDIGYVGSRDSWGKRLIDGLSGDRRTENIASYWSTIRTNFIDKLDRVEKKIAALKEENEQIRAWNNGADTGTMASLRLADKVKGVFQAMLTYGTVTDVIDGEAGMTNVVDFEFDAKYNPFVAGDKGTGGFTQFTAPLYADSAINREAVFASYGALKRKVQFDKDGREIPVPFSEAQIQEKIDYIEANHPAVVEVYNNYQRWNNELITFAEAKGLLSSYKYRNAILAEMQPMVEAGRITQEQYKQFEELEQLDLVGVAQGLGIDTRGTAQLWRDHSSYYPFYRKMVDDKVQAPNIAGGSLPNNPLSLRIEGSEEAFNINPIEAIARNSLSILTAAMKNDGASKLLRDLSEAAGSLSNGRQARRLDSPVQAASVDTVVAFENGQKVFYEVDDIELFHGLQAVGGVDTSGWLSLITAKPAGFLRDMVTRDPGFMVANLMRDTLSVAITSGAPINTTDGFTPMVDTFKNMFGDMEQLERFGVLGGYDFQNDEGSVKDFIRRSQRKQGLNAENAGKAKDLFFKAWDGLGALTTKSDGATRLAVYNAVYNDLKKQGATEAQAQSEAAFQALEIINFGRRGLNPAFRLITASIPFFNARIQGLDVLGRSFAGTYSASERLQEGESLSTLKKNIYTRAYLRGAFLVGITALYYMMVSDTDEYKKARREERDDNWILPLPFGLGRILIPTPFEVGLLFKTFPERFIDEFLGREVEAKPSESVRRGLATSLNVPFLNAGMGIQVLKPLAEYVGNRNSFTNTEIVPYYQLQLEEELQYRPTTNALVKKIAQTMGLSPIKVEHVLRGYTGTLGGYVLDVADTTTRLATGEPVMPPNLQNLPFIRRVYRGGERSQGGLQQSFYELRNEVDTVVQSMNSLRKEGRTDEYYAYKDTMGGVLRVKGQVRAIERFMKMWRTKRDRLLRRTDLNPSVKADMLEQLEAQRDRRLAVVPLLRQKANIPLFRI